ncbi:P-loop NTPase fold protein [Acinetobacter ursingii]|uniref:P-loop NTPase fold protein n=1 Tax=Acinetobacter ursingii TaxID=108980 RepID=UPI00148EA981|nr:P-loop NTPase fold protein [Acinetobacter ursingii]
MTISKLNKHIENYLDYYVQDTKSEYGIFIDGEWGAGKTWFIKKYMEKGEAKNKKFIYVSLNGLSSTKQIDDEIFRIVHPLLGGTAVKTASRIFNGVVKATLKIDIKGVADANGDLDLSLPNINLPDFLKISNDYLLIFDDLERCKIPLGEVFGYINHFIEQEKFKAIVIGNESKFLDDSNIKEVKEKFIETTFKYKSDSEIAIEDFLSYIFGDSYPKIKQEFIRVIIEVFNLSELKNLRSLRQSINNFKRFIDELELNLKDDEKLISHLLRYFLIFSLEEKRGALGENGKIDLYGNSEFMNKYNLSLFSNYVLDQRAWLNIIKYNIIEKDIIKLQLKSNYYDLIAEKPEWLKLWDYPKLSNSDFEALINKFEKITIDKTYNDEGTIKQIIGLFYFFKSMNLYRGDIAKLTESAIDNLHLILSKKNLNDLNRYEDFIFESGYLGYRIEYFEKPEYKSFLNNYYKIYKNILIELLDFKLVLDGVFNTDVLEILNNNSTTNNYYKIPVFKYVDINFFIEDFFKLDSSDRNKVINSLLERHRLYQIESYRKILIEEKENMELLVKLFQIKADELGGIEKYNIEKLYLEKLKTIEY